MGFVTRHPQNHEHDNFQFAAPTATEATATTRIMVIGGESVPWWRTDHAYLDDVEMLEVGEAGGENECPAPTNFPDSISAAAAAVMGE